MPTLVACADCCDSCRALSHRHASMVVTFSGVVNNGCVNARSGSTLISGTISGAFTVPRVGDGTWRLVIAGYGTTSQYPGLNCTGTPVVTPADLGISVDCSGGSPVIDAGIGQPFFFGTARTIYNPALNTLNVVASGGTATISW